MIQVPRTLAALEQLIKDGVEENQQLEYKAGQALEGKDFQKDIAKDVSAMANASGGVIVYGIREHKGEEKKHLPESITPIERAKFSKERLEQIINSNIVPKIEGILIHPVPLEQLNQVVYVVEVPQSTTAHQSMKDLLYYRRRNFEVLAMQDYEIRDVMNRSKHPRIELQFELRKNLKVIKAIPSFLGPMPGGSQRANDTILQTLSLKLWPINVGTQYAMYVNYFVDLPIEIVEKEEVNSLTKVSDTFLQHYGENTFRDVVEYSGYPKYGPSRFDPILPNLRGRSESIKLDPLLMIDNREILWRVHADNAPVVEGAVKLKNIALIDTFND